MYSVLLAPQDLVEGSVELQLSELLEGDCHDQMTSFSFWEFQGTVSFGPSSKQVIHNIIIYFADTKQQILQDERCHRSTGRSRCRCRATSNA